MHYLDEPERGPADHLIDSELSKAASIPAYIMAGILAVIWAIHVPRGFAMLDWAVSAEILREGHWENVGWHMLAHAGLLHLFFNCMALIALTPTVLQRLGGPIAGLPRFGALFVLSGFAGLALFLAIHPHGTTPMLGASGAIYGLLGFLVRYPAGAAMPTRLISHSTREAALQFIKDNGFLFVVLTVPALLSGRSGGVAWETHLGGFLFGLLASPLLAQPIEHPQVREELS